MADAQQGDGNCILLTDHPWPDLDIETAIADAAGYRLISGPEVAGSVEEIEAMASEHRPDAIVTCWAPVSRRAIEACPHLKVVARLGVGLDNIDVEAASARGVWVTNVPDYCVQEVSDQALGFVIDHCRGISRLNAAVKAAGWNSDARGLLRVSDQVIGILGYGRIGRETARKFRAMGCTVLASDPYFHPDASVAKGSSIADIQAECDVIIVHAPLLPETKNLVDADFLAATRRRPLIINVSRGPIVSNDALLAALDSGIVRGAALDVIDGEPAPPEEIIAHPRVTVTPHIAYASNTSMAELRRGAFEDAVRVLLGKLPLNGRNDPHG